MKTGIATSALEQFVTTAYNPEISAMEAICGILETLPDAAARMRVMRWSFSKYSDEFRRPLPATAPPASAPVAFAGPVLVHSAAAVVRRPPLPSHDEPISVADDIESQIAELSDLFPERSEDADDL